MFDTSQTSRISLAIPALSSQGREPGITALEGSWKPSYRPDGSHSVDILSGEYFEPGDVYTIVLTDITDSGDDYQGAEETTGAVAVGGSVTGNLEVDNDVDPFRVRLEADKSYRIRMRGSESGGGTWPTRMCLSSQLLHSLRLNSALVASRLRTTTIGARRKKDSELVVTVYSSKTTSSWRQAQAPARAPTPSRWKRRPPRWARGRTARRLAGRASPGRCRPARR